MSLIRFIGECINALKDQFTQHPGTYIVIGVIMLLLAVWTTIRLFRNLKGAPLIARILYMVIVLVSITSFLMLGIMLTVAGEVVELHTEQHGRSLYLELAAISTVLIAIEVYAYSYWDKQYRAAYEELQLRKKALETDHRFSFLTEENAAVEEADGNLTEASKQLLYAAAILILSILFFFTRWDTGLAGWGFKLAGKTIGSWIYGFYAGNAVAIIFKIIAIVFQVIAAKLFGNPAAHVEDAISDGVDILLDKVEAVQDKYAQKKEKSVQKEAPRVEPPQSETTVKPQRFDNLVYSEDHGDKKEVPSKPVTVSEPAVTPASKSIVASASKPTVAPSVKPVSMPASKPAPAPVKRPVKKLIYPGGTYYGETENGKMEGWGTYTFETGTVYEGNFHQNRYEGYGKLTTKGVSEWGHWTANKRNGVFMKEEGREGRKIAHASKWVEGVRQTGSIFCDNLVRQDDGRRKAWMIAHSGFFVQLPEVNLLFDCYTGELPPFNPDKEIFVMISHAHPDHFNPEIFKLAAVCGRVHFIVSSDIYVTRTMVRPFGDEDHILACIESMNAEDHLDWVLESGLRISIDTSESTDAGVAFLVDVDGFRVYHAGDLTNWYDPGRHSENDRVRLEQDFRRDSATLLQGKRVHFAMLPMDPRLGDVSLASVHELVSRYDIRRFAPMHQWLDYGFTERFVKAYPQDASRMIRIYENTHELTGVGGVPSETAPGNWFMIDGK
ncbi:MAG: MBL fold metallo-hydrolase [Firmicutes bacterium]|nr:MBL fold metallo-hydrolase [Bacillota bacterium]